MFYFLQDLDERLESNSGASQDESSADHPSTDGPQTSSYRIPKLRESQLAKKAKKIQNMWNKPIVYKKPRSESRNIENYETNYFEEIKEPPEVPRGKAKSVTKPKFSPVPIHSKVSHYDYKSLAYVGQCGTSDSLVLDEAFVTDFMEKETTDVTPVGEGPVLSSLGKSVGCPDAYFQFLCPTYGRKEAIRMTRELFPDQTSSYQGSVAHGEESSAKETEFDWEDDDYIYSVKYL